jgi:hypothetical protein
MKFAPSSIVQPTAATKRSGGRSCFRRRRASSWLMIVGWTSPDLELRVPCGYGRKNSVT